MTGSALCVKRSSQSRSTLVALLIVTNVVLLGWIALNSASWRACTPVNAGSASLRTAGSKPSSRSAAATMPRPQRPARVNLTELASQPLTQWLANKAESTGYAQCVPQRVTSATQEWRTYQEFYDTWFPRGATLPKEQKEVRKIIVDGLPCRQAEHDGCCKHEFSMRYGSTDRLVFNQVFAEHHQRCLHVLFQDYEPEYILDAGANAGFTASYFKMVWPDATVVSLEPDPDNYKILQQNTKGFKKMQAVNVGLWGWRTNISLSFNSGEWGQVFRESKPGEAGMPALSVKDIAAMFNIPRFDFVKIDIEGAEGFVFAPEADISWIADTKVVTIEPHDDFGSHFGLEGVTGRIDAAFATSNHVRAMENEHAVFISPSLLPAEAPAR